MSGHEWKFGGNKRVERKIDKNEEGWGSEE